MSAGLVSILLWIPFVLTALVTGALYCRSGYRYGLWRALITLGAVLLATVLSILLSGPIAKLFSPSLAEGFSIGGGADLESVMTNLVLEGLITSVLSLAVFWLLMLIFTIALRIVGTKVKKEYLQPKNKQMQWYGFGVGALAAVIFAFLWLSPLYGSLASYTPVFARLSSAEDAALDAYFSGINDHPIVKVSGSGPVALVYERVSRFSVNGTSVSVSQIADSAERVIHQATILAEAPEAQFSGEARKLLQILREDLVDQPWFYELTQACLQTVQDNLHQVDDPATLQMVNILLNTLRTDEQSFRLNCGNLLDFAQLSFEKDYYTALQSGDPVDLESSGFLTDAGALANSTAEAARIKGVILAATLMPLFENDFKAAFAFVQQCGADQPITDPGLQAQEAYVLALALEYAGATPEDVILLHPLMGQNALNAIS